MKFSLKTLLSIASVAATLAVIVYAFRPAPVLVDLMRLERGVLQVTVNDDGKTRIKERYVVSTPIGGRLLRIGLRAGDSVVRGETLLAAVQPRVPELLDSRSHAEADAKVKAAEAALNRAAPALENVLAELNFAETDLGRLQQLSSSQAISQQELDRAELRYRIKNQEHRSAKFAEQIAIFELEMARAALVRVADNTDAPERTGRFEIRAPISGRVLRVFQESATAIPAGEALLEIGDPQDLEVEIDVLSTDAVKIGKGDPVVFDQWGGDEPLKGLVRLVEPQGYTKVSALGIEEQRVNVIIDFAELPERRHSLGDGYRVEAQIVIWQDSNVLKVPTGALFRSKENWTVFVADHGRAILRVVTLGRRNDIEAEVLDGLSPGDEVIMHPSDRIASGVAIKPR